MELRPEPPYRGRLSTRGFLAAVAILLSLLAFSYSVQRSFGIDEFEHIHSAWYVANGYRPYADFFEHHHPLMWYCISPALLVLGYSTETVVVLRVVMFGLTLGIVFLTFLIARQATMSITASLFSVVLLLSMVMFVEKSVEIRPDVPQVLLGLISIYFFLRFVQTGVDRYVVLAGISASFSFLFLQKTVFLLMAYGAVFFHGLARRSMSGKSALWFFVSLSMPFLLFLAYLTTSGSFSDYVLTNWVLNVRWLRTISPLYHPIQSFLTENALFWLLSPVAVCFILLSRKTSSVLKSTAFFGIALLFSVLLVRVPYRQYYMFAIPLLCTATGYILERILVRLRLEGTRALILVVLILSQPLVSLLPGSFGSVWRDRQLARVDFVLNNSADSDMVYDGNARFNLYRRDLHYFWFSVGEGDGLDSYNAITNNRYGGYDACSLVRSERPTFISEHELDIAECGLQALYDKTPYNGLYALRELDGGAYPVWRDFGGVTNLVGYAVEEVCIDGEPRIKVSLSWVARSVAQLDYSVFVHLVGPQDTILAQVDSLLRLGGRTTSEWTVGQRGVGDYELLLPNGPPPEEYSIMVGVYYWRTGERLPVWDEAGGRLVDDVVSLEPTVET